MKYISNETFVLKSYLTNRQEILFIKKGDKLKQTDKDQKYIYFGVFRIPLYEIGHLIKKGK